MKKPLSNKTQLAIFRAMLANYRRAMSHPRIFKSRVSLADVFLAAARPRSGFSASAHRRRLASGEELALKKSCPVARKTFSVGGQSSREFAVNNQTNTGTK
jgi:hypothetical protein